MSDTDDPFHPGSKIGPYEIMRELGRGGMGRVYLAKDHAVGDRLVAVKVILGGSDDEASQRRFEREIKTLGKLKHPNIVTIFTAGRHQGNPFFVMDYVPGRDLNRFADECGMLGERERLEKLVRVLVEVARTVQHAHERQVVHRDLKPQNILMTSEADEPMILDFGIAKSLAETSMTIGSESPGTPAFRAPEQIDIELKLRDELVDVWALGVILYKILAGTMPFKGSDMISVSTQIVSKQPLVPSKINSRIPASLERIVMACLAKDPAKRPESMGRVADLLEEFLGIDPSSRTQSRGDMKRTKLLAETGGGAGKRVPSLRPPGRRRAGIAAVAVVFMGVLAWGAVKILGDGAPPKVTDNGNKQLENKPRDTTPTIEEQFNGHLADGNKALASNDLAAAKKSFWAANELIAQAPQAVSAELTKRVEDAQQRLTAAERAKRLSQMQEDARQAFDRGDLEGAKKLANEAKRLDPNVAWPGEILSAVAKERVAREPPPQTGPSPAEKKFTGFVDAGEAALARDDVDTARSSLNKAQDLLDLDLIDSQPLKDRLNVALGRLEAAERAKKLRELETRANSALKANDLDGAQKLAQEALVADATLPWPAPMLTEIEGRRERSKAPPGPSFPGFTSRGLNPATGMQDFVHDQSQLEFVLIPGGTFTMGSPANEAGRDPDEAQHEVTLARYLIAKYEVTQEVWQRVMGSSPSSFTGGRRPVEQVSALDAKEFCKKLGLELPTEAQWEYACRSAATGAFNEKLEELGKKVGELAWFETISDGTTHDVGLKKPNKWGLYDMLGNVWEWCADWYGDYPVEAVTNPRGPASGTEQVRRGGSWSSTAKGSRPAVRNYEKPGKRDKRIGFRPALSVP